MIIPGELINKEDVLFSLRNMENSLEKERFGRGKDNRTNIMNAQTFTITNQDLMMFSVFFSVTVEICQVRGDMMSSTSVRILGLI